MPIFKTPLAGFQHYLNVCAEGNDDSLIMDKNNLIECMGEQLESLQSYGYADMETAQEAIREEIVEILKVARKMVPGAFI